MLTTQETSRYMSIVKAINNLIDHVNNLEQNSKIYEAKINTITDFIAQYQGVAISDEQHDILVSMVEFQKSIVSEGMPNLNEEEETTNKLKKLVNERDLLDAKSKEK